MYSSERLQQTELLLEKIDSRTEVKSAGREGSGLRVKSKREREEHELHYHPSYINSGPRPPWEYKTSSEYIKGDTWLWPRTEDAAGE